MSFFISLTVKLMITTFPLNIELGRFFLDYLFTPEFYLACLCNFFHKSFQQ